MAENKNEKRGSGDPPLDYFDLSYVAPLVIANALQDRHYNPFRVGAEIRIGCALAQRAGTSVRRLIFERFFLKAATSFDKAREFRSGLVANWFTNQYAPRPYQYIILGPPFGSMAYLSSVLDAPFLPLNYRIAIKHEKPVHPDSTEDYIKSAKPFAEKLLERDPDVEIVADFDPVHERMRVSRAALLRFKFKTIPRAYLQFIRTHLAPGGAVILVESRIGWRQYQVGKDFALQVGLPGGISDEEFMRGSKRITEFRKKHLNDSDVPYRLKPRDEVKPESMLGVSPGLRASILNSSEELKRPVCQFFSSDIYQINHLVSNIFVRCARRAGKRPSRFFVHSGIFIAPKACADSLLLPVWVPDAGYNSFEFVQKFLLAYPFETDTALIALAPCVSGPPDFVPFNKWREAASSRFTVRPVGTRPRLFPYDFTSYFKFWGGISAASRRIDDPLDVRVNLDMLIEEAEKCGINFTMHQ